VKKKGAASLRWGGGGSRSAPFACYWAQNDSCVQRIGTHAPVIHRHSKNWVRVLTIPVQLWLLKFTRSSKFFRHSFINWIAYCTFCLVSLYTAMGDTLFEFSFMAMYSTVSLSPNYTHWRTKWTPNAPAQTIAQRRHIGIRSADCTMSGQLIPPSQSADCKKLFQLLSRGQISWLVTYSYKETNLHRV
jgi:hypothetical protein